MAKNTKQKILDVALDLFSRKGYEGTNLQEIADSVGIVKSALYRHFKSKEELWNCLLQDLEVYYNERMGSRSNTNVLTSLKQLEEMTMQMLQFTMHDERIIKTRKLLNIEQFSNERVSNLATKHFNDDLENMYTHVFKAMIKNGIMKDYDPQLLAFEYTAPISSLIHMRDRNPSKEKQIVKKIKNYVRHFIIVYGVN